MSKVESCRDDMNLIKDNGVKVYQTSGVVNGYDFVNRYFDFYENIYRIRRKSIYHRKYHVENFLNSSLGLPSEHTKQTKSKKTLKYNNQWWNTALGLIKKMTLTKLSTSEPLRDSQKTGSLKVIQRGFSL